MTEDGVGVRRGGYLDEGGVIDRIFDHIDKGTTDTWESTWREPVAHYQSVSRLAAEVVDVIHRWPVPFCPSAALPDAGAYLACDAAGVPIVAVRDPDGLARAYRNACRHRGASLLSGSGTARSIVCPYHGWVYRLDGRLRHVPDKYGFPGLDTETRGLVPVEAIEAGGLIYVDQKGCGINRESLDYLPRLVDQEQILLETTEVTISANWKIVVEGFLEGYHLRAAHAKTFMPYGYDNLTIVETSGPHSRVTFPFKRIESLRDLPRPERKLSGLVTVVDHIFPNVIIARLSRHTTVVVIEPLAVDRTVQRVYQLSNTKGQPARVDDARRDTDFVKLGAVEDLKVNVAVQRGLASGANEYLEFGRFEAALAHFHRQLDRCLGTVPAT